MTKRSPKPAAPTRASHDEQEATILHLRSQVTLLEAKLAAKRRKERAKVVPKKLPLVLGARVDPVVRKRQKRPAKDPDIGRDGCYKRGTAGHRRGVGLAMGLLASGGAVDRASHG